MLPRRGTGCPFPSATIGGGGGGGESFLFRTRISDRQVQPCATLSSLSSVVTGTVDTDTDQGCGRAMDLDMVLGSSPHPDDSMAPGGRTSPSEL